MSDAPRIVVRSRSGITPEQTRDLRARAWEFIFDSYRRRKAASQNPQSHVRKEVSDEPLRK